MLWDIERVEEKGGEENNAALHGILRRGLVRIIIYRELKREERPGGGGVLGGKHSFDLEYKLII